MLIWNFSDKHFITPFFVLETPIEIKCFEFHPEKPNIVIGGSVGGQMVMWDLGNVDEKMKVGTSKSKKEGEEKSAQTQIIKHVVVSGVHHSHKSYVTDIKFAPPKMHVDRRHPPDGHTHHFISISEDGQILIWDTRIQDKDVKNTNVDILWKPIFGITLFRLDGT